METASGGDGSARLRERERERRGRERGERSRGSRGLCGNARAVQGVEAVAGSRRWLGAWPAHDEHAPVLLAEEEDDRGGGGGGLGRQLQCWAGWCAAQVRPGKILSLSFISVFYFLCNFVAFLKTLKLTQKS